MRWRSQNIEADRSTPPAGGVAFNVEPGAAQASILIVDDHPANLLAFEAILAPLGHRLVKVAVGR